MSSTIRRLLTYVNEGCSAALALLLKHIDRKGLSTLSVVDLRIDGWVAASEQLIEIGDLDQITRLYSASLGLDVDPGFKAKLLHTLQIAQEDMVNDLTWPFHNLVVSLHRAIYPRSTAILPKVDQYYPDRNPFPRLLPPGIRADVSLILKEYHFAITVQGRLDYKDPWILVEVKLLGREVMPPIRRAGSVYAQEAVYAAFHDAFELGGSVSVLLPSGTAHPHVCLRPMTFSQSTWARHLSEVEESLLRLVKYLSD